MAGANHQVPRTLALAALAEIRRMILDGKLTPGTKINQSILAEQLSLSGVPIREALLKLQADGLVRIVPHHGAYVSSISIAELVDLYEIRELLEGIATRSAVPRLTDQDLTRLVTLVSEMEKETASESHSELLRLNREFHQTIYAASKREFLCNMISQLWDRSTLYRSLYVNQPGRSVQALAEHHEILAAAQERRVKDAVRLVRKNIKETMTGLLTVLKNRNAESAEYPKTAPGLVGDGLNGHH